MGTPLSSQEKWHGGCAEVVCLDKVFEDGVNPAGGKAKAVNVRDSGRGHNTPKPACRSGRDIMGYFGVEWE